MRQATVPRKSPKNVWLNATFEYFAACLESKPREAEAKIRYPAITRIRIEIKNGMSTFTRFI